MCFARFTICRRKTRKKRFTFTDLLVFWFFKMTLWLKKKDATYKYCELHVMSKECNLLFGQIFLNALMFWSSKKAILQRGKTFAIKPNIFIVCHCLKWGRTRNCTNCHYCSRGALLCTPSHTCTSWCLCEHASLFRYVQFLIWRSPGRTHTDSHTAQHVCPLKSARSWNALN